ncbi:MAG: hypothetical protein KJ063_09055 [Anaerolineae bacterium]|nr:hypothetical protein [Anaerolineae bacterium]
MTEFAAVLIVGLMIFLRFMVPVLGILLLSYLLKRMYAHWDDVAFTS